MKKKIFAVACCAVLLSISTPAYSGQGLYVSGDIGAGILSDSDITDTTPPGNNGTIEFDTGVVVDLAVGYKWRFFRAEGELSFQSNDMDKINITGSTDINGDVSSVGFLANGYYDITTESPFTPFLSAGLGFASISVNDLKGPGTGTLTVDDDQTVFAYQVGAGIGYDVNKHITIDLKYRYFATSDGDFNNATIEYATNNITIGIRGSF